MDSICEKCKYYKKHYMFEKGFPIEINCGHCENKLLTRNNHKKRCAEFCENTDDKQEIEQYLKMFNELNGEGYNPENIVKFLNEFGGKLK